MDRFISRFMGQVHKPGKNRFQAATGTTDACTGEKVATVDSACLAAGRGGVGEDTFVTPSCASRTRL